MSTVHAAQHNTVGEKISIIGWSLGEANKPKYNGMLRRRIKNNAGIM